MVKNPWTERTIELTHSEQQRVYKNKQSLKDLWNSKFNILVTEFWVKEKDRTKKVFKEIMADSFLNLAKHKNLQIQEAEGTTYRINPKEPASRHSIIKLLRT